MSKQNRTDATPRWPSPTGLTLAKPWFLATVVSLTLTAATFAASVRVDRESYSPGESITVTLTTSGLATDAWAGIVPSEFPHGSEAQNDLHDLSYQYIKDTNSDSLVFVAPSAPGSYDVRLHDTDRDGREVASVTFEVVAPDLAGATLSIDKQIFIPGERISIRFEAPAGLPRDSWVGIVPSSVPHGDEPTNDRNNVGYQYLERKIKGALDFNAPAAAGSYDFRLHDTDSNGQEIASVSFTVLETVDAETMAEHLASNGRVPLYGIRFASGQATLGESSASALAEVGKLLRRDGALRLLIEGHTDNRGSHDLNQALSERRSEAVGNYLIETFEIAPSRLTTGGSGDSRPMASNETDAGRAQNRRVELVRR